MHATLPSLPIGIQKLMFSGMLDERISDALKEFIDLGAGRVVSEGMARLIELGFGFLICDDLDSFKGQKARDFFDENFVIKDPNVEGGKRYYQGQFLIRTSKPGDDINVYIRFCPDIDDLYRNGHLNAGAIVSAEALNEKDAMQLEKNPDKVDLIIRFKDIKAILGLLKRPDIDAVQLLLENQVLITGNFGHMFKFGAIGKNAQQVISG